MGLLSRLRRSPALFPPNVAGGWREEGAWLRWGPPLNLVRESHHQEMCAKLAGNVCDEGYLIPVDVTLAREPRNRYDANAIRAEVEGVLCGYVAREVAAVMGPQLDEARLTAFGVPGVFRGGATRAPSLGLHLWLDRRTTPGPEITTKGLDTLFGVPWPPGDRERDRAIRVLRGGT